MLESLLGCKVNANVYVTPSGANQAFETHFDWMDSIIVQITGCKVWRVSSVRSALNPLPDTVFKVTKDIGIPSASGTMSQNSKCGDDLFRMSDGALLYLPRGFAHEAATNCSSSSSSSRSEGKSRHAERSSNDSSPIEDEISSKIPSIHITFGLETATDSTVEIFLHYFISISSDYIMAHGLRFSDEFCADEFQYLPEMRKCSAAVCYHDMNSYDLEHSRSKSICKADENPTHAHYHHISDREYDTDLCADSQLHKIESASIDPHEPQLLKIIFRSVSDDSILQVHDISSEDLLHLILHVAATTESIHIPHLFNASESKECSMSADSESNECSASAAMDSCRANNDATTAKIHPSLNSSLLRQAVATTTFTARNQYKPNLYDILPQSVEYLDAFLSSSSISQTLTRSLALGIDMGIFASKVPTHPKGDALSMFKKLKYIKRFITSSPSLLFDYSKYASISEIREIINFREWDVSVVMGAFLLDVKYFVSSSFELLNDSEESAGDNSETKINTYCASWKRMTDELRRYRTTG